MLSQNLASGRNVNVLVLDTEVYSKTGGQAFMEAEAYDGPSIIIAYAHCIAHGTNMTRDVDEHKRAVSSGYWPLYRYNPLLTAEGKNPLQLDSKAPSTSFEEYAYGENRHRALKKVNPEAHQTADGKGEHLVRRPFRLRPEAGVADLRR